MILHHFLFSLPTTDDDPAAEPAVPPTPAGQKRRRPRTMATVLVSLWRAARKQTKKIPDFEYRLEMVRVGHCKYTRQNRNLATLFKLSDHQIVNSYAGNFSNILQIVKLQ